MKKLILVAFSIATMVYSYGVENTETMATKSKHFEISQVEQDPIVVEMKLADLPEAVKELVATYQKKDWEASETAYHVTNKDTQTEHYEVVLKNKTSGEKMTLKIDKEGKELK